jgi:hypothetical protein
MNDLTLAVKSAPEAFQDPSLAMSAAQAGGDVQANTEVAAHASNIQQTQNATTSVAQQHGGDSMLTRTLSWLGGGFQAAKNAAGTIITDVGHIANMGMSDVQHQYRYIRDVIDQHGLAIGLSELAAIGVGAAVAGAVTGGAGSAAVLGGVEAGLGAEAAASAGAGVLGTAAGVVTGGAAAKLGGEAVGGIEGRLLYRDSWDRTNSPTYVDPHGGQPVSPGRDLARLANTLFSKVGVHVEQHAGFDLYDAISSVGDGLFDISTDPLAQGLAMRGAALSPEGLGGVLQTRWGGIGLNSEAIARAAANPDGPVWKALTTMADAQGEEGAAQLLRQFPKFRAFIPQIVEANTPEEVGQLLVDKADASDMLSKTLPRQTFIRDSFQTLRDKALSIGGVGGQVALTADQQAEGQIAERSGFLARKTGELVRKAATFTPVNWDPETLQMSTKRFDFGDTLNSTQNIYKLARWGNTEEFARSVAGQFALATLPDRMTIFRNTLLNGFANRMELLEPGLSQSEEGMQILNRVGEKIDTQLGGYDAGHITPQWGFDQSGRNISLIPDAGQTTSAPILLDQHPYVDMPDYHQFDRSLKSLQTVGNVYGKVDDFAYDHFTQSVFKKWVLLTGGFALRVATGELIPQVLADPAGLAQAKLTAIAARRGWSMTPEESEGIRAVLGRWVADKALGVSQEGINVAKQVILKTGGISAEGLSDDDIDVAMEMLRKNGNAMAVAPTINPGHTFHPETVGQDEVVRAGLVNALSDVPTSQRIMEDSAAWGPTKADHHIFWQKQLDDLANDPPTVAAARAYQDKLNEVDTGEFNRAAEVADKVANDAAQKAMRSAMARKERGIVPEAGTAGVDEPEDPLEAAAKRAAGKAARATANDEVGEPETIAGPKTKKDEWDYQTLHEALEPHEKLQLETVREAAYDAAHEEALNTIRKTRLADAHNAAVAAAKQELDNTPEEILNMQKRHFTSSIYDERSPIADRLNPDATEPVMTEDDGTAPAEPVDPHLDWARVITENMKGSVYGQNGLLNEDLLDHLANGETPDIQTLAGKPEEYRPNKIIGVREKPLEDGRKLGRFNQKMFDKLNGTINWLSREPIYMNSVLDNYGSLYKDAVDRGEMTFEEGVQRAQERSVMDVLPMVHNINERTLMADTMKNWMPFYFAQQQSYSRLFRLAAEDPATFRLAQLAYTKLADFGGIYTDENGNQQVVMPGLGYITQGAVKALGLAHVPVINSLPMAFSGNLQSLATLSPFMEGNDLLRMGPLVSLAARPLNNLLPETKLITDPIVGTSSEGQHFWEMLIPNAPLRALMTAVIPVDQRTQNKSVLDAIQALEAQDAANPKVAQWLTDQASGKDPGNYPGQVPPSTASDEQKAAFIAKVKNQARITTIFKAIYSAVSPISPSVQLGDYNLKSELYSEIQSKGVNQAVNDFLVKHPDATPYTVFETDHGLASPIEASHPAQQWVMNNLDFINSPKYSAAASYFIPQNGDKFNQEVYNEQMAMGLRSLKAPQQLIDDVLVAEGNRWYFNDYKPAKDAAMAKATSTYQKNQIAAQFKPELDTMKAQNPTWYTNFSSGGRNEQRTIVISQLHQIFANNAAPSSPMTDAIKNLLDDYDAHTARMLPGRTDASASYLRKQETAKWQAYVQTLANDQPELTNIINSVFRSA